MRLDCKENAQGSHKISEESQAGRDPPKLCVRPGKSLAYLYTTPACGGTGDGRKGLKIEITELRLAIFHHRGNREDGLIPSKLIAF